MVVSKKQIGYAVDEQYAFNIELEEGFITIWLGGNGDLYWSCLNKDGKTDENISKTFRITEANDLFYDLIKELYSDIYTCNVFKDEYRLEEYDYEEMQLRLKQQMEQSLEALLKNGVVDYHSDDNIYEVTSRLLIETIENEFKITFIPEQTDLNLFANSVRICNSGSRYKPFNVCFMNMYHKLIEYTEYLDDDQKYHQISISEYIKLSRKKSQ